MFLNSQAFHKLSEYAVAECTPCWGSLLNAFFLLLFFLLYGCFLSVLISFEQTLEIVTATYFSRTLKHLVKRISKGSYPQLPSSPIALLLHSFYCCCLCLAHWLAEGQRRKWLLMSTGCVFAQSVQRDSIDTFMISPSLSCWAIRHAQHNAATRMKTQIRHNLQCSCPSFAVCFHILYPDAAADQRTRSPAVAALRGSLGRTVKLNDSASSAWHMLVFVALGWKTVSWHRQDSLSGRHTINMQ